MKIILPGGAGLVGQNLVAHLKESGYDDITVIDKHLKNIHILEKLQSDIKVIEADLSILGEWQSSFKDADVVVMLQAQIGAKKSTLFHQNNVDSAKNILRIMKSFNVPYLVHISSSVVESIAQDNYTITKKEQENLVVESGIKHVILRPTLMFGWFDRKHLGWLSRFMNKVLFFPIPGHGKYMRQPLYVKDFCNIMYLVLKKKNQKGPYNITGNEKINYIDIIREIKKATNAKTIIIKVPYTLFYTLLWIWALFDRNPPFTTQQLEALIAKDEFEIIDWPSIFEVVPTPFNKAIEETFNHPEYSKVDLEF